MARKVTRKPARKKTAAKKKTTTRKATAKRTTRKTTAKKSTARRKATTTRKTTTAKKKTAAKRKSTARATTRTTARTAAKKTTTIEKPKKVRKTEKPKNKTSLSYTQSEFMEHIKGFCGLEKKAEAKEIWDDISLFIVESLRRGYRVPLVGLGKMYVRKTKARQGRNPATGETIQIPARKRVRFSPAKQLKEAVL